MKRVIRDKIRDMNDVASPDSAKMTPETLRILLYSDDLNVRDKVIFAVGSSVGDAPIEWIQTATHDAVVKALDTSRFDLAILDGETAKSGGMGIARQIKREY